MKKFYIISIALIAFGAIANTQSGNIILHLPFDGNANDFSSNAYHGVVHGARLTTDRNGIANKAYYFDGVNDYIMINQFGNITPSREITVSMWIQSEVSKGQFQMMLCPDNNRFAVSVNYFHANRNHNFWDFGWTGAGGNAPGRIYTNNVPHDKKWHHYAFTSSISGSSMKIYRDGKLLKSENDPLPLKNFTGKDLRIGSGHNCCFFKGKIDDIQIYNKALSSSEISNLASNDLVLHLPFDGNANDFSSNANHGIVHGARLTTDRNGIANKAYYFDGVNDYIMINQFGNITPSREITVSMWIQSEVSKGQFQMMLCPDNNRFAVSVNYFHANRNHNFWDFGWTGAGGNAPGRIYTNNVPHDKKWHHYAFTSSISGSSMKIYRDGKLLKSENDPLPLKNFTGKDLKIGSGHNCCFFKGKIDDIKIFSKALSASEISSLLQRNPEMEIISMERSSPVSKASNEGFLINIYPNPVHESINIELDPYSSKKINHLQIVHVNGKVVYNSSVGAERTFISIGATMLSDGIYFLQLLDSDNKLIKTEKLIIKQ